MSKQVRLDKVAFEIKFAFGHIYLDRCGQVLVEIERTMPGWVAGEVSPNSGRVQCPAHRQVANFNTEGFHIIASRPHNLDTFCDHATSLWRILRSNLGLDNLIRIGARFYFLLPAKDLEQVDERIANADLNVRLPSRLDAAYTPIRRHIVVILKREEVEYRVELSGVERTESIPPPKGLPDPRLLAKHQQKARIDQMRWREAYDKNPMYAVSLDIDCVQYEPETSVNPDRYIRRSFEVVTEDFKKTIEGI
ncbi:MAG: hypothetical protein GY719_36785 [bacterium]|nr:hypothetical protein [bacterium]